MSSEWAQGRLLVPAHTSRRCRSRFVHQEEQEQEQDRHFHWPYVPSLWLLLLVLAVVLNAAMCFSVAEVGWRRASVEWCECKSLRVLKRRPSSRPGVVEGGQARAMARTPNCAQGTSAAHHHPLLPCSKARSSTHHLVPGTLPPNPPPTAGGCRRTSAHLCILESRLYPRTFTSSLPLHRRGDTGGAQGFQTGTDMCVRRYGS